MAEHYILRARDPRRRIPMVRKGCVFSTGEAQKISVRKIKMGRFIPRGEGLRLFP